MSPRPKTASDAAILDAAARLLARSGPARMRLEDVAREVGLSPATLLLRFKSKKKLLLAVAEQGISGMAEHFRERRLNSASPLHAITEVCDSVREMAEEPQQLANLLAFLQLGLEDPEFRVSAQRHDATLEQEMARLLEDAREKGEVVDCCTRALARAVIAMMRGSLLTWSALGQHTTPEQWVRADIETLLGPYRGPAAPRAAPPRAFAAAKQRAAKQSAATPRRHPSPRPARTAS
jgi:AcrR family transcriptional regulator